MTQDDETDQAIGDDVSEKTRQSTLSSDIEEDDLDHHQVVLHVGQACRDKSLRSTSVPLSMKLSRADTVIAHPPLPNSRNLPAAMAPPLLKHQKSFPLIKSSESDCAPSAQPLVKPNTSSGDQNSPQPKASCDQNVAQQQDTTFEVAKRFMGAIVFTKTHSLISFNDQYLMVEDAWKLAIEGQDRQRAIAGAPIGTPSVCQLTGGPSHKINQQTREAVSLEFCLILLYQASGY